MPIFFVNPVGGTSLGFAALARALGADQPFYALQDFGLASATSLTDLAHHYIEAIRSIQPSGPYLVGGYSFGGAIAFEIARQLHHCGEEIGLLALIDSASPARSIAWMNDLASAMGLSDDLSCKHGEIDNLEMITTGLRLHKLLPADMGETEVRQGVEMCLSMLRSATTYHPGFYSQRVLLFRAMENELMPPAGASESFILPDLARKRIVEVMEDPTMGWKEFCSGPLDVHEVQGNHFTIIRPPNVSQLADKLSAAILEMKQAMNAFDEAATSQVH